MEETLRKASVFIQFEELKDNRTLMVIISSIEGDEKQPDIPEKLMYLQGKEQDEFINLINQITDFDKKL